MSDIAYDISHLPEAEPSQADTPVLRATPTVRIVPAPPAQPGTGEVQKALAHELIGAGAIHDALVQQYLRISSKTFREPAADKPRTSAGLMSPFGPT